METKNLDVCRQCGGICCKRMACHFSPDDFSVISFKALKKEIEKGYISIDYWYGDIDTTKDRYFRTYYLRIRNKDARILDASWGVRCGLWDEKTGCPLPFEKRPKGARALIPAHPAVCRDEYTKEMCVADWRKHHTILKRLAAYFADKGQLAL